MHETTSAVHVEHDHGYAEFEKLIADRVAAINGPLFTTDAEHLFTECYLPNILAEHRQHYTCWSCRKFVSRYGGLVQIDDKGITRSPLWDWDVPEMFKDAVMSLSSKVCKAKVTGVFVNGDAAWGNATTGEWTHLHGTPPKVFNHALKNAGQEMAEKLQDFIMLKKGMVEVPMEAVVQAIRVLEADAVDRSEKTLGVAKWLLNLHRSVEGLRGRIKVNVIWLAVATAPPGWCHVRSTMIATLLDDVVAGLSFEVIKRRWNEKMHPLQYQRPTAPPKEGNIDQANKVMEKLGSEGALRQRFARLDEVVALWRPKNAEESPVKVKAVGTFDHLRVNRVNHGNGVKVVELPARKITWNDFRDDALQQAVGVEVMIDHYRQPFYGLVTAVNVDSPPMLQWDGLEGLPRNQVAWYFWHGMSLPSQWGLSAGWNLVAAISLKPCHWHSDKFAHQGGGIFFAIEAARDSRGAHGGYFPETLRSEYHGIRSVIEAHSKASTLEGKEAGNANGIALDERNPLTVRTRGRDGVQSWIVSL